jgi:hypothetical protein
MIRRKLLLLPLLMLLSIDALAQQKLTTKLKVESGAAEVVMNVAASAPGASWEREGAEAPLCNVYVDGKLNQNIVIFQGEQSWTYKVFLGKFTPGQHELLVERDARWSAPGAGLHLEEVEFKQLAPGDREYVAVSHAPILQARADTIGRYSDLPLLMYYEELPAETGKVLQYTIIFTNEDAGTATDALMARWGRTTDIEYIYRVHLDDSGRVLREVFQAPEHKEQDFRGEKEGDHPLILNATLNNVFSDRGYTAVHYRMLPFREELGGASREKVMDENPWTYRLSAQEMQKEQKVREYGVEAGAKIGDARNYLYLEFSSQNNGCGLIAWAKRAGDPSWHNSHRGRLDFSITRGGWVRTTIELPPGTNATEIEQVALECVDIRDPRNYGNSPRPTATLQQNVRGFLLNRDYVPAPVFENSINLHLAGGQKANIFTRR